jgi:hypothetical protein
MSRAQYSEDIDGWELIRWRGAVAKAIKGKRGQAFLREMLIALDALPDKRLIAHELEKDGEVCAIGSVGKARGIDLSTVDPEDYGGVAATFGVSQALVREIEFVNDDWLGYRETPEQRFQLVRSWVAKHIVG